MTKMINPTATATTVTAVLVLVVTASVLTSHTADGGCFEDHQVLDPLSIWVQPLSIGNRLYYYPVSGGIANQMSVESEPNLPKHVKRQYTCLQEYDGNRMMVQVEENSNKPQFQCLQFKPLSTNVVRQSKTKLRALRKKVDCENEDYVADEAVLVAMDLLQPQPCTLQGGYQMLLYEGAIIRGHCMDSVQTYNPSLRFQCDKYNVIADFGRACEPPILREGQKMRRRHIAHLSCVGSWIEKGNIQSLLLRMRDNSDTLWCIHYRQSNSSNELLSVFMTLDGRCVEDAFHDEAFPKKTSLFGHIASYVPSNDARCSDTEYLDWCKDNEARCFESNDCPANCQRCNVKASKSSCGFIPDTFGHWKTVDSRPNMTVDINSNSIRVSNYGEFSCRGEADVDLPGKVYPVVQSDDQSTCLPYYACAHVESPIPGVLHFKLQPAWRDEETGEPFTCKQTEDKIGYVTPVMDERMITMINPDKLVKSSCGFDMAHKYPTLVQQCQLEVDECGSDCSMLVARYDNATCGEQSTMGFPIETDHYCYGKFEFTDGIRGMLTYSEFSERYFCWIYGSSRLFIAPPADCTPVQALIIFADPNAHVTYDPLNALSKPLYSSSSSNGENHCEKLRHNGLLMFSVWLLSILLNHLRR